MNVSWSMLLREPTVPNNNMCCQQVCNETNDTMSEPITKGESTSTSVSAGQPIVTEAKVEDSTTGKPVVRARRRLNLSEDDERHFFVEIRYRNRSPSVEVLKCDESCVQTGAPQQPLSEKKLTPQGLQS